MVSKVVLIYGKGKTVTMPNEGLCHILGGKKMEEVIYLLTT